MGREVLRFGRFGEDAAHGDDGTARAIFGGRLHHHPAQGGAEHAEGDPEVPGEGGLPAIVVDFVHRPVAKAAAAQARDVEQRVEASEPGQAVGEDAIGGAGAAQVAGPAHSACFSGQVEAGNLVGGGDQ